MGSECARGSWLWTAALAAPAQGAMPQAQGPARTIRGCYGVRYDSLDRAIQPSLLPTIVALSGGPDSGLAVALDTVPFWHRSLSRAKWRRAGDLLRMWLANGEIELAFELRPLGDSLVGNVAYTSDVAQSRPPGARVRAIRRACPRE